MHYFCCINGLKGEESNKDYYKLHDAVHAVFVC